MPDLFTKELAPSYKRVDAHMLDPRDLRLDPMLNGRVDPPSEEDIQMRVTDFLNPSVGQLQSVLIAKDEDGYPIIVDGHIRWEAAMKITKEGKGPFDGVFKLKCTYFVGNPLERYIATIKANIRKEPTFGDNSYNVARLIHNFQMSEEDVAIKVFSKRGIDGKPDVDWIKKALAYSELAPELREAITDGRVKPNQIEKLAKLAKTAQRQVLKSVPEGHKVTASAIRSVTAPSPAYSVPEGETKTPAKRKWDKQEVCAKLQEWIDLELPPHIAKMDADNAIRTVLSQIQEEIECGGC